MEPSQIYRRDLRRCRYFSREEERELWERMKSGDGSAREALILSMLPLVVTLAVQYCRRTGYSLDDAIENGNLGVLLSLETFDPAKGRLSTYAHWRIRREIRFRAEEDTVIRVPQHVRYPQAGEASFTAEQRNEWMELRNRPAALTELAPVAAHCEPEDRAEDHEIAMLRRRIAWLREPYRGVIEQRLNGRTFAQIACRRRVTKQRAQQIAAKAVEMLRAMYEIQAGAAQ